MSWKTRSILIDRFARDFPARILVAAQTAAAQPQRYSGGLPIRQLRKVQDYFAEHLADGISEFTLTLVIEIPAGLRTGGAGS